MKYRLVKNLVFVVLIFIAPRISGQQILPFPSTPSGSKAGLTMESSTYQKRVEPRRLPANAPNILIILMDDLGPGTASTYGGEVQTPTLERVSKMGISYNRFHSTAMCSPTRASLLTGRNHTFVGNGQISAIANDFDGFSGTIPKSSATVAEVLKNYGYNTVHGVNGIIHQKNRLPIKDLLNIGQLDTGLNTFMDFWLGRLLNTSQL